MKNLNITEKGLAMTSLGATFKAWIKNHPIGGFSILGIAICFGSLFPAIYVLPHDAGFGGILGFYLGKISTYSPVIAGIAVTKLSQPGRHRIPFVNRLRISLPAWAVSMVVSIVSLKLTAPPTVPLIGLIVLSIPVSLLPAWVISSAFSGSESVRTMLLTLIRPKGSLVYYLFALMLFPVTMLGGAMVTNIMSGAPWLPSLRGLGDLWFTVTVTFLAVFFFAGGMNEEAGWRGFAQKRLQAKHSPLITALILWFLMVIWHIPNDLLQYRNGGYVMIRLVLFLFITILFVWIYNRTGGSILAVAIFHCSMNSMNPLMGIVPITMAGNALLIACAIVVAVVDRMWRRLPPHHSAVYQGFDQSDEARLADTAVPVPN